MQNLYVDEFEAYASYLADTDLQEYTYEYVMDWDDAEDVVKEAMTIAARRRDEFDPNTGPDGLQDWLRAICRNLSKSYTPYGSWEESPVFGDQAHMAHYSWRDNYEQAQRLRAAKVLLILREPGLTSPQRECLRGELNGESQTATARRLDIRVQTVNEHLSYAKKKLNPNNPDLIKQKGQPRRRVQTERERSNHLMSELLNNINNLLDNPTWEPLEEAA